MTPFLLALLGKLTLLLALGLSVAAILRRSTPSLRHLVLLATIACAMALPLVMRLSPRWDVAVLPASATSNFSSPSAASLSAGNGGTVPFAESPSPNAIMRAGPSRPGLTAASIDAGSRETSPPRRSVLASLPVLPLVLWALGSGAVLAWLAIGRARLRRIVGTSWPLGGPDWSRMLDEARKEAGVAKTIRLFSSSVVSTPLTWGWRVPVILLPEDAVDWPDEHRRIVLRHELAHVARGDAFAQLLAGFACALYWMHPLVWIAARRLRAECERACDDHVVALGTPAVDYAAHLLEVARSARAFGVPGFLSLAMARPSHLEGRLFAVLDESRRRVALSRGARRSAIMFAALVLVPLAAFRAAPKASHPTRQEGSADALSRSAGSTPSFTSPAARSAGSHTVSDASTSPTPRDDKTQIGNHPAADSTLEISTPATSGETLTLDLKTGGRVVITGWDKPEVFVRASLGGRDWRFTEVTLQRVNGGTRLRSDYNRPADNQSSRHLFEINVPRNFNVRLSSAGGSVSITGVNGIFTGSSGGGEIDIRKANGEVDIRTGGGNVHVSDSRLNGSVSTGGGAVRIEGVTGNLNGYSGSGPVTYARSESGATISIGDAVDIVGVGTGEIRLGVKGATGSGLAGSSSTTTVTSEGAGQASRAGTRGIRMSSAGGAISLPAAPEGARVTTGGGRIRIGPSGGEVYASTGGGTIDIGPASGSVEAHTGAGDVTIEITGGGSHSVDVTSGNGDVVLVLPPELDASLDLESAYTDSFGRKTRIVSDWPLTTTETNEWDSSEGTPRRYVRARQPGHGGGSIRVRTVNGNIVLRRSR